MKKGFLHIRKNKVPPLPRHPTYQVPESNTSNHITIKDILIPILSALFVVLIQQSFFESNQITELEIENIKKQIPALNRITLLSDGYVLHQRLIISTPVTTLQIVDQEGNVLSEEHEKQSADADTALLEVPSFVIDSYKRKEFNDDINFIKDSRGLLDYDVYVDFEKLLDFLNRHPLPSLDDNSEIVKSNWNKPETHDEYFNIISRLYKTAIYRRHFITDEEE